MSVHVYTGVANCTSWSNLIDRQLTLVIKDNDPAKRNDALFRRAQDRERRALRALMIEALRARAQNRYRGHAETRTFPPSVEERIAVIDSLLVRPCRPDRRDALELAREVYACRAALEERSRQKNREEAAFLALRVRPGPRVKLDERLTPVVDAVVGWADAVACVRRDSRGTNATGAASPAKERIRTTMRLVFRQDSALDTLIDSMERIFICDSAVGRADFQKLALAAHLVESFGTAWPSAR